MGFVILTHISLLEKDIKNSHFYHKNCTFFDKRTSQHYQEVYYSTISPKFIATQGPPPSWAPLINC